MTATWRRGEATPSAVVVRATLTAFKRRRLPSLPAYHLSLFLSVRTRLLCTMTFACRRVDNMSERWRHCIAIYHLSFFSSNKLIHTLCPQMNLLNQLTVVKEQGDVSYVSSCLNFQPGQTVMKTPIAVKRKWRIRTGFRQKVESRTKSAPGKIVIKEQKKTDWEDAATPNSCIHYRSYSRTEEIYKLDVDEDWWQDELTDSATVSVRDMVPATSPGFYPCRPNRCGPWDTLSSPVRPGQIEICHTSSLSRLSVIDAATVRPFVIYVSSIRQSIRSVLNAAHSSELITVDGRQTTA